MVDDIHSAARLRCVPLAVLQSLVFRRNKAAARGLALPALLHHGHAEEFGEQRANELADLGMAGRDGCEEEAFRTIEARYTPEVQRQLIEAALDSLLRK